MMHPHHNVVNDRISHSSSEAHIGIEKIGCFRVQLMRVIAKRTVHVKEKVAGMVWSFDNIGMN
jgi:hypothetical protein